MDRSFEATPPTLEQPHRPRNSKEGGFLNTIRNMSGWVRTAIAALGLLVVDGCAHAPKSALYSEAQSARQVCIVWRNAQKGDEKEFGINSPDGAEKAEQIKTFILHELYEYFRDRFSHIRILDLSMRRAYAGLNRYGHFDSGNKFFVQTLRDELPLLVSKNCDDIIGINFVVETYRNVESDEPFQIFSHEDDIVWVYLDTNIFNIERDTIETYGGSVGRKIKRKERDVPIEDFFPKLRVDLQEKFGDRIFAEYHPDQLPPLSDDRAEIIVANEIKRIYRSSAKTKDEPFNQDIADQIKKLSEWYLARFPNGKYSQAVKTILADVTERPSRLAEKERRRAAAIERGKEKLIELRSKLQGANDAEYAGSYQRAYSLFDDARNAWLQVNAAYQDAQIPLTHEIEEMGREVIGGIQRNAGRIGIVRPAARPAEGPSAAFSAGWEMLRDQFIAELPNIGIVTTKIIEVGEKLHEDLARQGITAELEVKFVNRESHSSERLEDMEVTVTQKSPSYYSRTFKTSKGDLIAEGGRAMFYLVPGTYEISCARCKEPHTMEVRSGKSSLTLEMY